MALVLSLPIKPLVGCLLSKDAHDVKQLLKDCEALQDTGCRVLQWGLIKLSEESSSVRPIALKCNSCASSGTRTTPFFQNCTWAGRGNLKKLKNC